MTHQTYFKDIKNAVQTEMLAEFSDKTGAKDKLIDVEAEKAKLANKPLPGQLEMEVKRDGIY